MSQKRRLRTAEWRQNQVDQEVAFRVEEALANLAERKKQQKLKEGKKDDNSDKSEE